MHKVIRQTDENKKYPYRFIDYFYIIRKNYSYFVESNPCQTFDT